MAESIPTFQIRSAEPSDVRAAQQLMRDCVRLDFGKPYDSRIHSDIDELEATYLRSPGHFLLVAQDLSDGRLVGTAAIRPGMLRPGGPPELVRRYADGRTAQLVRVYTGHADRRRGIALALVQAALERVAAEGKYDAVALHTYPHSPGSVAFWTALGAVPVGEHGEGSDREVFFEFPHVSAQQAVRG